MVNVVTNLVSLVNLVKLVNLNIKVNLINLSNLQVTAVHNGQPVVFEYDHLLTSMPITLLADMLKIDRPLLQHSKVALVG